MIGVFKSHRQPQHLTDEQFTGLLLGSIPSSVQSHLRACSQCSEEAERVSSALGSFACESRLWAELQVAASPAAYPVRLPVSLWQRLPAAWAVAAVALVIATTLGVPHAGDSNMQSQGATTFKAAGTSAASEVPAATLQADNDLLAAIDGKLQSNDTPQVQLYELKIEKPAAQGRGLNEVSD